MAAEKLAREIHAWLIASELDRRDAFHGQLVCVRLLCGAGDDGDLGSVGPI